MNWPELLPSSAPLTPTRNTSGEPSPVTRSATAPVSQYTIPSAGHRGGRGDRQLRRVCANHGGYSKRTAGTGGDWTKYVEGLMVDRQIGRASDALGIPRSLRPYVARRRLRSSPPPGHGPYHAEMLRRLTVLQQHNLWHEDRTSSAASVEARVPFLDHRLVEHLAKIPARHHAALFWDKEIVRIAAARWLPTEMRTQPKIGFNRSAAMTDSGRLYIAIATRLFPAFRGAYLGSDDEIFDEQALVALSDRVRKGPGSARAAHELVGLMAIAVFERLCRTLQRTPRFETPAGPSPLQRGSAQQPPWAPKEASR